MDRLLKDKECCQIVNISRASWWNGVRKGIYPKPVRLSTRTTRWKQSEVMALVENGSKEEVK